MKKIAIIGLGHVGLPLALEFAKNNMVCGFDINKERIEYLNNKLNINNDLQKYGTAVFLKNFSMSYVRSILKNNKNIFFTNNEKNLSKCNIFIITVPTPLTKKKLPDLSFVIKATQTVAKYVKKKDLIIYESTVYPGVTEEICLPIIQRKSKLKLNKDFFLGYSPERLSPGDKEHGLKKTIKITSGSNKKASDMVDRLYKSIVLKGTFKASSIKVAEAAKLVENIQRDINIAFVNELVFTFSKLNIRTGEVLKAAGTKWNFAKYRPGLVGGSCIPVNPYYLKYKSSIAGYKNRLIPSARKINDEMCTFLGRRLLDALKKNKKDLKLCNILILGFAYKKNATDTRHSQVFKIYKYFKKKKIIKIDIYDPLVDAVSVKKDFGIKILEKLNQKYDGIILAVPHKTILRDFYKFRKKIVHKSTKIIDVKYMLKKNKQILSL